MQAERDSWREAEKKRNLEELRRIREYQELQQKRYDEMMSQKKAKFDVQDSIMQQLARDMEAKRREVRAFLRVLRVPVRACNWQGPPLSLLASSIPVSHSLCCV